MDIITTLNAPKVINTHILPNTIGTITTTTTCTVEDGREQSTLSSEQAMLTSPSSDWDLFKHYMAAAPHASTDYRHEPSTITTTKPNQYLSKRIAEHSNGDFKWPTQLSPQCNHGSATMETTMPTEDISCTATDTGGGSDWPLEPLPLKDKNNNCNTMMGKNNLVETVNSSNLDRGLECGLHGLVKPFMKPDLDLFRIMVDDSKEELTWAIEGLSAQVLKSTSSTTTGKYYQATTLNTPKLCPNLSSLIDVDEESDDDWAAPSSPKLNLSLVRALTAESCVGELSDWSDTGDHSDEDCSWAAGSAPKSGLSLIGTLAEDSDECSDWSFEIVPPENGEAVFEGFNWEVPPKPNPEFERTLPDDSGIGSDWSVESEPLPSMVTPKIIVTDIMSEEETGGLKLVTEPTSQGKLVLAKYGLDIPSELDDYWAFMYDYLAQKSPQHDLKIIKDRNRTLSHLYTGSDEETSEYRDEVVHFIDAYVNLMTHFIIVFEGPTEILSEFGTDEAHQLATLEKFKEHFIEEYKTRFKSYQATAPENQLSAGTKELGLQETPVMTNFYSKMKKIDKNSSAVYLYCIPSLNCQTFSWAIASEAVKAMKSNTEKYRERLADHLGVDGKYKMDRIKISYLCGYEQFGIQYVPGVECYTQVMPFLPTLLLSILPKVDALRVYVLIATKVMPRFFLSVGFPGTEEETGACPGARDAAKIVCIILYEYLSKDHRQPPTFHKLFAPKNACMLEFAAFTAFNEIYNSCTSCVQEALELMVMVIKDGPIMQVIMTAAWLYFLSMASVTESTLEEEVSVATWSGVIPRFKAEGHRNPKRAVVSWPELVAKA
eukprot:Ihof_evm2s318 gene=Ihof_evmTU2s318